MGAKASTAQQNGTQSPRSSTDVVTAGAAGFNLLRQNDRQRARSLSSVPDLQSSNNNNNTNNSNNSTHHHHNNHHGNSSSTANSSNNHHHHSVSMVQSGAQIYSDENSIMVGRGGEFDATGIGIGILHQTNDENSQGGISAANSALGRVYTATSLPSHIWSLNENQSSTKIPNSNPSNALILLNVNKPINYDLLARTSSHQSNTAKTNSSELNEVEKYYMNTFENRNHSNQIPFNIFSISNPELNRQHDNDNDNNTEEPSTSQLVTLPNIELNKNENSLTQNNIKSVADTQNRSKKIIDHKIDRFKNRFVNFIQKGFLKRSELPVRENTTNLNSNQLIQSIKCPVCSKFVLPDDIECHLVMCLTKPRLSYNEDVLNDPKGECVICLEDLNPGDVIARLPCLCIYHKGCIDRWFEVNRCCPEHPGD